MRKKVISIALILCMIFSLMSVSFAAQANSACINYAKSFVDQFVTGIRSSGTSANTADLISKFVNGSGKTIIQNAFNQLYSGGRETRIKDVLGLDPTTLNSLLTWLTAYNGNSGKSTLENLVNGADSTQVATDLANKYVTTVGDVYKAENQLFKLNAALVTFRAYQDIYKPIKYDGSQFAVNSSGVNNLIAMANQILGNDIENEQNKQALINTFTTLVNGFNNLTDTNQKLGAKALFQALGLLYVEATTIPTSPFTGSTTTTTTKTTTTQPTQPIEQPVKPQSETPKPTNVEEALMRLMDSISKGDFKKVSEILTTTVNIISTQQDIAVAVDSAKSIIEKVASSIDKISNINDLKSVVSGVAKILDTIAEKVGKSTITTTQKVEKLAEIKGETLSILAKAYEASSIIPQKKESTTSVALSLTANDISSAVSKNSDVSNVLQGITNKELKQIVQTIGQPLSIKSDVTGKAISVALDKDVVEKVNDESKINSLLIATAYGTVIVPKSELGNDKVEINITPKNVSETQKPLSDAIDVTINSGDKTNDKFNNSVTLVFKLKQKPQDALSIAAYRLKDGKLSIVPGVYAEASNQYIVERKTLSTYYVAQDTKVFTDVKSNEWYYSNVKLASSKGIISGYPDSTFRPQNNVTRAEFAKMIVEALQFDTQNQDIDKFVDIKKENWYYPYIATLYNLGIVNGRTEDKFMPNAPITREEMAKIVALALQKAGKISSVAYLQSFNDVSNISTWAQKYVAMAVDNGIMQGTGQGKFEPKKYATRAEVAAVAIRALMK